MKKTLGAGKPRMKDVLEALKMLEDSEKITHRIEGMRCKENINAIIGVKATKITR